MFPRSHVGAAGCICLSALTAASPTEARRQGPVQCGPPSERLEIVRLKKDRPVLLPGPGKALVVLIEESRGTVQPYNTRIAFNGQWVAVTKHKTFAVVEVEPGLVRICLDDWDILGSRGPFAIPKEYVFLTAEPNKTYYFLRKIPRLSLRVFGEISEAQGRAYVSRYERVTLKPGSADLPR